MVTDVVKTLLLPEIIFVFIVTSIGCVILGILIGSSVQKVHKASASQSPPRKTVECADVTWTTQAPKVDQGHNYGICRVEFLPILLISIIWDALLTVCSRWCDGINGFIPFPFQRKNNEIQIAAENNKHQGWRYSGRKSRAAAVVVGGDTNATRGAGRLMSADDGTCNVYNNIDNTHDGCIQLSNSMKDASADNVNHSATPTITASVAGAKEVCNTNNKKAFTFAKVPGHIAVIMDGNRRFGREVKGDALQGHWAGGNTLVDFIKWCIEAGVKVLTVYAFSTENWSRDPAEIATLMSIFIKYAETMKVEALKHDAKVIILSTDSHRLPLGVREAMHDLESSTAQCSAFQLNICLSYGARAEIVNACNQIIFDVLRGELTCNGKRAGELKVKGKGEGEAGSSGSSHTNMDSSGNGGKEIVCDSITTASSSSSSNREDGHKSVKNSKNAVASDNDNDNDNVNDNVNDNGNNSNGNSNDNDNDLDKDSKKGLPKPFISDSNSCSSNFNNYVDEGIFSSYLTTKDTHGDPDMLIRTSGECRLSNFLLWQVNPPPPPPIYTHTPSFLLSPLFFLPSL